MLNNYQKEQENFYKLISNSIKRNKLSHAYLINSNNCSNSFDIALSLAKTIICPSNKLLKKNCDNCNICGRIDNDNYLELKIITPNGKNIKKEQLIELQNEFSLKGLENKKRVYIICDSEKLNNSSSNCILKFLEEPLENVYAILLTNDINKIISTIISRCQVINLKNNNSNNLNSLEQFAKIISTSNEKYDLFVTNNENKKLLEDVINFVNYYEKNGVNTIIYIENKWHKVIDTREKNILTIHFLINFYYEAYKYKLTSKIEQFMDNKDTLEEIVNKNSENQIINKINSLIDSLNSIENNANINLLVDNLIIQMEGVL